MTASLSLYIVNITWSSSLCITHLINILCTLRYCGHVCDLVTKPGLYLYTWTWLTGSHHHWHSLSNGDDIKTKLIYPLVGTSWISHHFTISQLICWPLTSSWYLSPKLMPRWYSNIPINTTLVTQWQVMYQWLPNLNEDKLVLQFHPHSATVIASTSAMHRLPACSKLHNPQNMSKNNSNQSLSASTWLILISPQNLFFS